MVLDTAQVWFLAVFETQVSSATQRKCLGLCQFLVNTVNLVRDVIVGSDKTSVPFLLHVHKLLFRRLCIFSCLFEFLCRVFKLILGVFKSVWCQSVNADNLEIKAGK